MKTSLKRIVENSPSLREIERKIYLDDMRIFKKICATSFPGLFSLENGIDGKRRPTPEPLPVPLIFAGKKPWERGSYLRQEWTLALTTPTAAKSSLLKSILLFPNCVAFISVHRKCHMSTCRPVSLKLIFCSRAGTEKKCTKMKASATCKIVVFLINLLLFWRSLRRRRCCLRSLMLVWDRNSWHCK